MASTQEAIRALDGKGVIVTTHEGETISMGKLRYTDSPLSQSGARLELCFETEDLRCVIGVPSSRHSDLLASCDGEIYRYALPPGDHMWLPQDRPSERALAEREAGKSEPVIETFSLPPPPERKDARAVARAAASQNPPNGVQ